MQKHKPRLGIDTRQKYAEAGSRLPKGPRVREAWTWATSTLTPSWPQPGWGSRTAPLDADNGIVRSSGQPRLGGLIMLSSSGARVPSN